MLLLVLIFLILSSVQPYTTISVDLCPEFSYFFSLNYVDNKNSSSMCMFYFQGLFRNHPSFWNAVSVCNYLVHCCSSGRTAAIVSSRCLLLSFIISFFTYSIFSVNMIKKEKQGNCNENSGRKSIWGYSQNPMFLFICIMRKLQDCILVILLGRYNRESILLAIVDAGLKAAEKNTWSREGTSTPSPSICLWG